MVSVNEDEKAGLAPGFLPFWGLGRDLAAFRELRGDGVDAEPLGLCQPAHCYPHDVRSGADAQPFAERIHEGQL